MNMNKLKKMIEKAQIISFDIFDTLLLRTYAKPVDLFYHLEKIYNIEGFAKKRIEAESVARSKKEEVTIYDIYSEFPEYTNMLEKEIALEIKNLHKNNEIYEIYQYALSSGKRIVITSDMYLPYNVIEKLLVNNGYDKFSNLFLSNIYTKTKRTGKLFDVMLKELKVSSKDILHIGDNYDVDYLPSIKKGMRAFHYKSVISRFLDKHKNLKSFFENNKNYELSVVMALSAENEVFSSDYWYNIGFLYGGIVATSYIDFIKTKLEKSDIKDVIFVARDGYTLKRIFDTTDHKQISHYVYAPRALNKPELKEQFKQYLNQYDFNSQTAMVETISGNFTAQNMIQNAIEHEILGFYITLDRDAANGKLKAKKFVFNKNTDTVTFKKWDFVEFLLSAPELSVCGLSDNKPMYKQNVSCHEYYRKKIYQRISNGIYDFNHILRTFFTTEDFNFSFLSVVDWFDYFSDNPGSLDKKHFSKIYHAIDSEHKHYTRLFHEWYYKKPLFSRILEKIFSLKNSENRKHKIVTILGIKIKFRTKNSVIEDIFFCKKRRYT